jgi:hypothetical protein
MKKNKRTIVMILGASIFSSALFFNAVSERTEITPEQLCEDAANGILSDENIDITHPPTSSQIIAADPKGIKNAYDSFQSAAKYFSNRNDGIHRALIFPKGTYKIDNYTDSVRDKKLPPNQQIQSVRFSNSSNFRIVGCNAKINVKGDFHKTELLRFSNGMSLPQQNAIIPFMFSGCSSFGVYGVDQDGSSKGYGLELNGNVNLMSRDLSKRIIESGGHGIYTKGCHDYQFSNLNIHHFSTDGFVIGAGGSDKPNLKRCGNNYHYIIADTNGKINHVLSSNNARQGISVIQAVNLTVTDSIFSETGRTGLKGMEVNPKMPGFSPQAGVDIEPDFDITPVCVANCNLAQGRLYYLADKKTNNIAFNKCQFRDNIGRLEVR